MLLICQVDLVIGQHRPLVGLVVASEFLIRVECSFSSSLGFCMCVFAHGITVHLWVCVCVCLHMASVANADWRLLVWCSRASVRASDPSFLPQCKQKLMQRVCRLSRTHFWKPVCPSVTQVEGRGGGASHGALENWSVLIGRARPSQCSLKRPLTSRAKTKLILVLSAHQVSCV